MNQAEPRPLLVTAAIIHDGTGPAPKILIAKRRFDSKNEAGKWEFPGGKVEFAENPEDGIAREIREELAVDIRVERLYGAFSHVFEISGTRRHLVLLVYVAAIEDGQQPQTIEVEEVAWVDIAGLDRFDFTAADRAIVQKIKAGGI